MSKHRVNPGGPRAAAPQPARVNPGGPAKPAPRHHHPKPARVNPGGLMRPGAGRVNPGGRMKRPHKKRGLALDGLACCAAEAVVMSLRLAGAPVSAADTEALFWLAGGDEDAGASILATLEAARGHGLVTRDGAGTVLGLDFAGDGHAVLADGGTWWSWGEPMAPEDFPGAVIEEAWTVRRAA